MSATQTQQAQPVHLPPKSDEEMEREAIRELERMERALNAKRSNYRPKRRGRYANRG
ncbi:MAG: hypothetical protein ACP59X_12875 [Solidesulfovibrio sp. DCME]|uniref:hypothetical protein n=1 Tax=Solidesulfovibrio sp. DCME TaxID=3447380 RepID=UPI003D11E55E